MGRLPTTVKGNDLKGFRILVSLMVHVYGGQGSTISINGKTITQVNHSEPVVGFYKPGDRVLLAIQYGRQPTASELPSVVSQKFVEEQPQILRLRPPRRTTLRMTVQFFTEFQTQDTRAFSEYM